MLIRTGLVISLAMGLMLSGCNSGTSTPQPSATPQDPSSPPPGTGNAKIDFEPSHVPPATTVSFNTRGTLVATGGDIVRIWDVKTGHLVRELPANGPNPAVAFSPDGSNIAVGGFFVQEGGSEELPMGQVIIFDTGIWKAHRTLIVQGGAVSCLAWSPDGQRLAASRQRGSVTQWEAKSGNTIWKRDVGWSAPTDGITYSPDGKVIGVSSRDGTLKLVNADTGAWIYQLRDPDFPKKMVRASTFTSDGKTAISVGDSGHIVTWDVGSGKKLSSVDGGYKMNGVAISDDGNLLATVGTPDQPGGPGMTLWDARTMTKIKEMPGLSTGMAIAISPTDKTVCYVGAQFPDVGGIHLADPKSGADIIQIAGQQNGPHIAQLAFSVDGKTLAMTVNDAQGGTYLWDVPGGKLLGQLQPAPAATDRFFGLVYGSKSLGAALNTGSIQWGVPPSQPGTRQNFDATTASAPALLASGSFGTLDVSPKGLEIRDDKGAVTQTLSIDTANGAGFPDVATSADGKLAALVQNNDKKEEPVGVTLFDLAANKAGATLDYSGGKVNDDNPLNVVTFSADGNMIGVGSVGLASQIFKRHGYVDVWNKAATTTPVFSIDALAGNITSIAFSPDDQQAASSGHGDARIRLYDVKQAKLDREILTHEDAVALAYSPDGKYLAAACSDGSCRLYATGDRSLRATYQLLPPADPSSTTPEWAVYSPPGYYEASQGASKYLFWRKGSDVVAGSEYANVFHRPDLMVQSIHPVDAPALPKH